MLQETKLGCIIKDAVNKQQKELEKALDNILFRNNIVIFQCLQIGGLE